MQFYTENLTEKTLQIEGNNGSAVGLTNEAGNTLDAKTTHGFLLAGVDIPYPTGSYVERTGTALQDSASLCWVPRCIEGAGQVAWVLSLVNGSCSQVEKTDIACAGSGSGSESNPGTTEKSVWKMGAQYYLKNAGLYIDTTLSYSCTAMEPITWLQNYLPFTTPTVGGVCIGTGSVAHSCHGSGYDGMYIQEYVCQKQ